MIIGRVGEVVIEDFAVNDDTFNHITGIDSTSFHAFIYDPSDSDVTSSVSMSIDSFLCPRSAKHLAIFISTSLNSTSFPSR